MVASAELRRQQLHDQWLWDRQLGSKAGEEIFVDPLVDRRKSGAGTGGEAPAATPMAPIAAAASAGVVANKPERHLALLRVLHPPEVHFTPARAPLPYPQQTTPYSYQNVGRLRKRMLELYDVAPYENEKQYLDGGWTLLEEDLWPKPKPPRETYGLPRVDVKGEGSGGGGSGGGAGRVGKMAPSVKANAVGVKLPGVCYFKGN